MKFRILNRKKESMRGYTLAELLAVTAIIVVVSGLIVGILYSTLRGGNKTKVTNDVAQNGNYALSVISHTALSAQSVMALDGVPVSDCTTTPQAVKSIQFELPQGAPITFSCSQIEESIASVSGEMSPIYLIDNRSVRVDPNTCSFSCTQADNNPYSKPVIKISFVVSQRASSALVEGAASSTFSTSVAMRNYSPR